MGQLNSVYSFILILENRFQHHLPVRGMTVCPEPLTAKIQVPFLLRFVTEKVALSQVFSPLHIPLFL
jgi:hypothetical protein